MAGKRLHSDATYVHKHKDCRVLSQDKDCNRTRRLDQPQHTPGYVASLVGEHLVPCPADNHLRKL